MSTRKVTTITAKTSSIVTDSTTTRSRCVMPWKISRPRAGQEEHVLDDDRARQKERELQTDDRQHRDQRVLQRMAQDGLPPREALGARGADVVLAERLQKRRPHHAGEDRGLRQGQRDGRRVRGLDGGARLVPAGKNRRQRTTAA